MTALVQEHLGAPEVWCDDCDLLIRYDSWVAAQDAASAHNEEMHP